MTGLEEQSFAKCESIGPLHESRFKKKIGHLPLKQLGPIEDGIRRVLSLAF